MWNKFEASSNEDETVGNSFFTAGLFKISNEEESAKNPQINAALQNNKILISVDNSLILLEDLATDDCKFLSFGSEVDCFAVSKSGDLVVCCLSDGNIHGIHIRGIPLFNLIIQEADINTITKTFLDIIQVNDEFIVMCNNGKVYKIHNLDPEQISEIASSAEENELKEFNETILSTTTLDMIQSVKLPETINSFCCVQTNKEELFIACAQKNVFFITNSKIERIKYPANVSKIKKVFNLDNFVLGLTESGDIIEICPSTKDLRVAKRNTESSFQFIEDLRILESNEDCIELLVLTSPNQLDNRTMKVLDFPSMKPKNELLLPGISWLVSQQKSAVNMYFISGTVNDKTFVQSIEVKSIIETDPEQRFKKLLQRGHFDEAEEFAKQYNLNLEPLYEARVKRSLMSLQGASKCFEKTFKELMMQISNIQNPNFLVSLRLSEIPHRASMTTFLEYLLKNIDTNLYQNETNEINELLLRLETLRLIDPDECNMQWQKFLYHSDMSRLAMDYFKSDVLLSCLIWSRHSSSIIPKLNLEQFHKWLGLIPSTIEPFQLIQWLRHFAPCFLQMYPNEMTYLVDWCIERTRSLQFSNAWPEIGLEFINTANDVFKDIKFMFVDIKRSSHKNMEKLQQIIFTLQEMVVLKKTYHLTMTLDDYSKRSLEETAYSLLQRIQIKNLKGMVNDFLYPIFIERGGSPENTIVKYIQFLCSNKNLGFWQERAVESIDLLHNEENRLNSALMVLKTSPVPWSNVIMPLAKLGTTSSHPLANSIYIEYKTQSIKMIKMKYQWPVDYFDLPQDRVKLVFRILKVDYPDAMEDVKTLARASPDLAQEAYFFVLHHLVMKGEIEEFVEMVKSIGEDLESTQELFAKVIDTFIEIIDESSSGTDEENYLEAIKLLVNRSKNTANDELSNHYELIIKNLKNIINVRRVFNFQVKLADLRSKVCAKRMFEEGIAQIVVEADQKQTLQGLWSKMDLLVRTFGFDRMHGLKILCKKMNNLFVTSHVIDVLCSSIDAVAGNEIESTLELVVLILAQQVSHFENNLKQSFDNYDPLVFPLTYELLMKCLKYCNIVNQNDIMTLLRWTRIGRNYYPCDVITTTSEERIIDTSIFKAKMTNGDVAINDKRRESYSMFEAIEEKSVIKQQRQIDENLNPAIRCICNCLKMIIFTSNKTDDTFSRLKKHLDAGDVSQLKNDFFGSLEKILKLKQYEQAMKIMQLVVEQQEISNLVIIPAVFKENINKKILKYLLSQKTPDYLSAFRILRSEGDRESCLDYLRSVLKNNSQKIAFSTFSEMYNNYIGNVDTVADERQNRLKFYYYSELCKYDPSLRFQTSFDGLDISDLLKDLENRQLSVELVKKLSKDFGWDYQQALVCQVKIALKSQELEFEIKTDEFGKDEVIIKSTVELIRKKCSPYFNEITNTQLLASEMFTFMKEINYYFYEMYLVVLEMVELHKELTMMQKIFRNVLFLLKHKMTSKRRRTEQKEAEAWQKLMSENSVLPAISKYRLPFKPMMEETPESFLNDELNVDTFEKCIPLISMHATYAKANIEERLEICGFQAVKNSVLELKAKMETSNENEWNLKPTNNAFLQSILRMVSLLKDKSKRMAILYFHVNHSPEGSDQVEAAYECWKFAIENEAELIKSSKYVELVEKIKRKYPLFKTQHLLHLYGLTDDKLMQLVESPTELINALYHHESILTPQKKDINKLCKELTQLYEIDLLSLQHKLLHKWLAFVGNTSLEYSDPNETVYEDFIGSPTVHDLIDTDVVSDESVVRAHYILSSWTKDAAMSFLAGELSSCSINTENQLQMYECFAKLVDDRSESYMELINPANYLLIRSCHYLKQFGLHFKPEKFKEADKVDILKKIWTSQYNNSKGLEVMSFICLGFNIHLPQIWNGILKQMVQLKMIDQLSILVEILSTKSKLLHLSNLKLAWECVINEPFLPATKTRTYDQDLALSKALLLLQKCPISTFLNLDKFIQQCLRLDRPYMAAIFVAFVNENDREKYIKVLESCEKSEMKKNIIELEEMGVAPVITKSVINILKL